MAETANLVHTFQFVDDISQLAIERAQVRAAAETLLDSRKQQVQYAPNLVPLPIDALSTADKVRSAQINHGSASSQHQEAFKGLLQDCTLLVAEWNSKQAAEIFPELRHKHDASSGGHYSHGMLISQMTQNGIVPIPESPEDEARRINEHVEEHTPSIARRLGVMATAETALITFSECTDKAEADYANDLMTGQAHRGYGGYVPEISKLMIRRHSFADNSEDRLEQQVALPGEYLQHEVLIEALGELGLRADNMDKTQLHGEQILTSASLHDIVSHLDNVASKHWGVSIFMGRPIKKGTAYNYAAFEQQALQRQEQLHELAAKTAEYILDLANDPHLARTAAPAKVEQFVKVLLLDYYQNNTKQAVIAFDTQTALGLQEVGRLRQIGQLDAAMMLLEKVERSAPGGGYCGAGSCGLESVKLLGKELEQLKKNLRHESGETMTKDVERHCGKCGEKGSLYYSHRATGKPKKFCQKCNSKQ